MLFGHTYYVKAQVKCDDDSVYNAKFPIEARFVTEEELKEAIWNYIEYMLPHGIHIDHYISLHVV